MSAVANDRSSALLQVSELGICYRSERGAVQAVDGLSFDLARGETLGIVGESGSGKTQTALAIMGLLPDTAEVRGSVHFAGSDMLRLDEKGLNGIRGRKAAMIFQDPMTALNPHLRIGTQMSRVLERHRGLSRSAALQACAEMLDRVRVPSARERLRQYPHEMSGGMRQRIMIATALLCQPQLLIADEPTTALDVTVQAQILKLMRDLQAELHTAILLITHDMGVVAANCDRVLVMRDGVERERGSVEQVFYEPADRYTRDLLAAVPRLDGPARAARPADVAGESDPALLRVQNLSVRFAAGREHLFGPQRFLRAVSDVSFELRPGETLGVVGESGCGKSTLARAVLQLLDNYEGSVTLLGKELHGLDPAELTPRRRDMQVVFQDPLASLNPRMTVGDIVTEPLRTFRPQLTRAERLARAQALLVRVGLRPEHVYRYPHEFSGGQCQRIGIARALICDPQLVICDEPVSALDVSVQAQVVQLLLELQRELNLALVFIAHDLAVVKQISHRVMVMYLGRVVEVAPADVLYRTPQHPYTQALISAVPVPDPRRERARRTLLLEGDLPSPLEQLSGCAFRARCPLAFRRCAEELPVLLDAGHSRTACHAVAEQRPKG